MAEKDFHVTLPHEVIGGFGWKDAEVPHRVREALVMILGLARWELLELMGRNDIPAVRMSIEDLDRELATEVKRNSPS